MSDTPFNDVELWNAIRKDDKQAFNTLFRRYWIGLYKTANSYFRDKEVCQEVVHDVFLNVWKRRHELEILIVDHFLLTAVRYQVYNRMRAAKLTVTYTAENIESTQNEHNTGESKLLEEELFTELQQRVGKLPKRCQEIFYLSRLKHLSNEEIAAQLGISKRTVDNQITLALKYIKLHYKSFSVSVLPFFLSEFLK
jgi:RNA polymerase sigma-70 factor (ECF subfamily)